MSWQKVKLGELCVMEKGNIGITKAIAGEYPLVVTSENRKSHNEYQFDDEAVIIPLVSSTGHGHKSLKRIHYQEGKFAVGSILCAVIPKDKSILNAHYLYRYLDLNKENELVARMKGMANVTLPMKEIANIEIPLPDIETQFQFVEKINSIEAIKDDLVAEQETQLTHLRLLRKQILSDAMQGKLDVPRIVGESGADLLASIHAEKAKNTNKAKPLPEIKDPDIPFAIPEHWTWCRLGDIFKFIDYRGKTPVRTDTGVRLISAKNIKMGYIDNNPIEYIDENHYDSWMVRGFPKNGDLLFVTEGHTMGFVAQIDLDFKYILAQRTICLQPYSYDYSSFTKYLIMSEPIQRKIKSMATGAAATGVKSSKLKELVIPLPPLSEQIAIVSKIESLMALCNKLEVNIRQNQEYTQMLYQTALREALQQPA